MSFFTSNGAHKVLWGFCASLTLLACDTNAPEGNSERKGPIWAGVALNWNRLDVYVEPDVDSLIWYNVGHTIAELDGRDSSFGETYRATIPMSPAGRDSILVLASSIVADAVQTSDWVTCYAGDNVRIKLTSGATSLSLSYGSVKDWLSLNPKHSRLKAMTFDRFDSIPKERVHYQD